MKRFLILALIMSIIAGAVPSFAEGNMPAGSIALHVGSPLILSGKDMIPLDSDNPNVVPVIHKERTLVPLRAISEHFDAEVSYNSGSREAVIKYNGKSFIFPIDKNFYRVEEVGKPTSKIAFDTESLIIQDRTMVPLRVVSEDILGKTVGYSDKVITIGSGNVNLDLDLAKVSEIKSKIGQALKVSSAAELKKIIGDMSNNDFTSRDDIMKMPLTGSTVENTAAEAPAKEADSKSGGKKTNDFSTTNEQVEGINEADIIKTDGTFIYVATGKSLKIYKANNGKPVLTDEISMVVDSKTGQFIQLTEMYIDQGKLIVLGSKDTFNNWIRPIEEPIVDPIKPMMKLDARIGIMPQMGQSYTYVGVYNINTKGDSSLLKEFEIEGNMLSSRKKDNTVYLVVNQYLNYYYYGATDGGVIPMYRDSARSNEYRELPIDSIMYYPGRQNPNYLIVAAIDINGAKTPSTVEAFLGSGSQVYMSNNALYIAGQDYNTIWGTITNISKFTVDDLKIGFAGGGFVEGSILNQFSMDEYEGNLRIATTNWQKESLNAVYILDKNLNEVGSVKNMAPGESIYSVRFMGDKGYVVTFRQIDPLFVIDLSSPTAPKVVGELKIPGFSNYLHPISEDILLGIGQSIDEKTGRQEGIKLSIFDVSDSGKPREVNNLILGSSGSYAEVLNNHKALMLNLEDDMIGFTAQLSSITGDYAKGYFNGALIIEVKETGEMKVLNQISNEGIYGSYVDRIIYIGDVLYYVQDDTIRAFNINTFQEIK